MAGAWASSGYIVCTFVNSLSGLFLDRHTWQQTVDSFPRIFYGKGLMWDSSMSRKWAHVNILHDPNFWPWQTMVAVNLPYIYFYFPVWIQLQDGTPKSAGHLCVFFWEISLQALCSLFTSLYFFFVFIFPFQFCEFLIYFEYQSPIRCTVWKYFLPFHKLTLHSLNFFLSVKKLFSLMQCHLSVWGFVACVFGIMTKNIIKNHVEKNIPCNLL